MGSLREQCQRECFEFPTIKINKKHDNINDYEENDIEIHNYLCHNTLKMKMRE